MKTTLLKIIEFWKKTCRKSRKLTVISSVVYTAFGFNRKQITWCGNNQLIHKGAFLKKCCIKIEGNNNIILIEQESVLKNCKFYIQGNDNRICIGKRAGAVNTEFYIEDCGNSIIVGENTGFCGDTHMACTEGRSIKVGKACLFSSDIFIRTGDSHSILDITGNRINQAKDVVIDDAVWIGNGVKILKGARIGKYSVVATGSVITKSVDKPNVIIGGNPARIMKENVSWIRERI